jgi:branched-chain amino acid transport system substrate-binding protein
MPLQQAIQLAVSRHADIHGYRVGYLPLDDSIGQFASPLKGVQNVKRMIADPRVLAMIGPYNSYVMRQEIYRSNPAHLVMVSPSVTGSCLTVPPLCDDRLTAVHATGPYNLFRIAAPDPLQGTAMGRYAGALNIKRVAAFNEWGDDGNLYIDHFAAEFTANGGTVVLRQDLPVETKDFTDFLATAKARGAEAIYALGDTLNSSHICAVAPQMKSDFAYFLVTDGITGQDGCAPSSGRTLGTLSDVDPTHSTDPAVQAIVSAYRKAYPLTGNIPGYTFAAYDCALILIDAISRAIDANGGQLPSRLEVLDQVAKGRFDNGVTGSYSFNALGDAISPLMSMSEFKNGHWSDLGKIEAGPRPS